MPSSNLIQTPLGIETDYLDSGISEKSGSNLIQTPLGIETIGWLVSWSVFIKVPTSSKPH